MNELEKNEKKFLMLYKSGGKFYNAYGKDAYIINYLFGYKILDNKKCGFPNTVITKVINKLEEEKISYQVINPGEDPSVKDYKGINKYNKYLLLATENLQLKEKLDLVIDKLKNCSKDDLEQLIGVIDKCLP